MYLLAATEDVLAVKSGEDKTVPASAPVPEMAPFKRYSRKPYKVCAIILGGYIGTLAMTAV